MGLDMYLEGRTFNWTDWKNPENNPRQEGFEVKGVTLKLGYWRKHPDLHGYIVKNFADGRDECQPIDLGIEDVKQIIAAIKSKELPPTEGFFFGASDGSEDDESIKILERAIEWAETKIRNVSKDIVYQASW